MTIRPLPPRMAPTADYSRYLEDHVALVTRAIRMLGVTGVMSAADVADFRSEALLHLMADDYRVLRVFEGRSSLATYLTVVLKRLWQDKYARRWGRWRPSAEARRLGDVAVQLERLVQRDGWTLDDAVTALHTHGGVAVETLRAMWARVPTRAMRRQVGEDALETLPAATPATGWMLEHNESAMRVSGALRSALAALPHDDRQLLRWRFVDGWSMADIARHLRMRQSHIYPRFLRVLRTVRTRLEAQGIAAADAAQALGDDVVSAA